MVQDILSKSAGQNEIYKCTRCIVRAVIFRFSFLFVIELLIDTTYQLNWNHIEAVRIKEKLLLIRCVPCKKTSQECQMFGSHRRTLCGINREHISVEILRKLVEQSVG